MCLTLLFAYGICIVYAGSCVDCVFSAFCVFDLEVVSELRVRLVLVRCGFWVWMMLVNALGKVCCLTCLLCTWLVSCGFVVSFADSFTWGWVWWLPIHC